MDIAVSFDKDTCSEIYQALIDRFEDRETAVYGNNLTHWFPDAPRDFSDLDRLDHALRKPDLIIALYSPAYHLNYWMTTELNAFLQLEAHRNDRGLVLVIPTLGIDPATIPRFFKSAISQDIQLQTGSTEELDALAAYIEKRREKARQKRAAKNDGPRSNKIFVVHGHDHHARSEIEIFLRDIGLEPIVLERALNEGSPTIIEKFLKYSDVDYAVVLLTPDDKAISERDRPRGKNWEHRARQNVIFELGYFIGRMGAKRVCCVYKEGVTPPSDISNFVWQMYSQHVREIKFELVRELTKAGYAVSIPH